MLLKLKVIEDVNQQNENYWEVVKNVKNNLFFKDNYIKDNKHTDYYPTQPKEGGIYPLYTSISDDYMIYNIDDTINYNESRPYLLIRNSIVLKNKICNYIKNPHLFEINIISKTRLFNLYDYLKNYNLLHKLNKNEINGNMILVMLQKLCYNFSKNIFLDFKNKNLLYMLYSTWLNYKLSIKPYNNLYRFVHYAKYFYEKDLYENSKNTFNGELNNFFRNNIEIANYLNFPEVDEINNYIDICKEYNEKLLLEETEKTTFVCKTPVSNINIMNIDYDIKEDVDENEIDNYILSDIMNTEYEPDEFEKLQEDLTEKIEKLHIGKKRKTNDYFEDDEDKFEQVQKKYDTSKKIETSKLFKIKTTKKTPLKKIKKIKNKITSLMK
jgi:hypothetical protein